MQERLIERLLWDKRLTPAMRWVWVVLILVAPLALAAGIWLQSSILHSVPVRMTASRSELVEQAHALANKKRLDARNWDEYTSIASNPEDSPSGELYKYLLRQGEPGRRLLVEEGLWSRILVRLQEPESPQSLEVWFAPTGQQTGYRLKLASHSEPQEAVKDEDAFRIAEQRLNAMLQTRPWLTAKDHSDARSDDDKAHVFRWNLVAKEFPDLTGEAVIRILGRQPTQESLNLHLDEAARERIKGKTDKDTLRVVFVCYTVVLTIYCWIRYFKRRAQKEVSRQRMLLVALLIGGFIVSEIYLEAKDLFKINLDSLSIIPSYVYLLLTLLIGLGAGMMAGLAYSSTEGDLREIDPRRLTSLDALLSGKLFSRNVGRSVVLATVLLGWMTALWNLAYRAGHAEFPGSDTFFSAYEMVYSREPLLSLALAAVSAAIFLPLVSLFAPAALVWRRVRRPPFAIPLIILLLCVPLTMLAREPFGWGFRAVLASINAAGFLTAFLFVDVLTTMVLSAEFVFLSQLGALSDTAPIWKQEELWAIGIAAALIGIATVCAFIGRVVDEDAVRPTYAKEIHERQQLEMEVEAAREAQQRLLPGSAPAVPGLSVAASCQAAEAVSGDFYDFFLVGKDRLGILISDGGGNGLATALMIAFAKGFLMEKAQAGWSAVQTLRALETTMGQHLGELNTEGLFYALLDVNEGTLRFARIGDSPGVLLTGTSEVLHEGRSQEGALPLWEGHARLTPSTRIILYTNGVCRLIGEPDCPSTNRWIQRRMVDTASQTASSLHDWLLKTIFTKRVGRGKRVADEDVTVLVVGVDRVEAKVVEHVA